MATCTWDGGTDNWNDAANWNTDGATDRVPITGDDVVINTAGATVTLDVHIGGGQTNTGLGSLTITAGTLTTNDGSNRLLTVTGTTTIGPNSGAADQATLTCNASTVSLGASETSSYALRVAQGGTFTGGTGAHTIGSLEVVNSAAAKCTMTSGECSISSERSGSNRAILVETNATFDNNDGTIKITHAGDTNIEFKSGTTSPKCPHNLTIDKSDNDVVTHGDLRIDNNLFIKIVDTSHSMRPSSASDTLTVIGDVTLNKGKLGATTNYTSAISFGSLKIDADGEYIATSGTTTITSETSLGFALDKHSNGTFTHNSGTVTVTTNTNTVFQGFEGTVTSGTGANALNNLIVNLTGSANYYLRLRPDSGTALTILGDVTVTQGKLEKETNDHTLTINGDVSVGANGTLGHADKTGNDTFGSIVIAGTVIATSGTTTITNEKSGHAWKNNGGTFTHNNGKVLVDFDTGNLAGSTEVKENTFYDLEVKLDDVAYELRIEDHSSTNAMDILNNLTVTKGIFDTMTKSDTLTIHGQTIIESDGVFTQADHDTNKIIHNGIVRNSGTYKINDGTTVKMNGGIRNLGTITVA